MAGYLRQMRRKRSKEYQLLEQGQGSKEFEWRDHKFHYLSEPLEEKRKYYKCGENFKTMEDVKRWGSDCHFAPQGEKLQQLRDIYGLPEPKPQEPREQGPQASAIPHDAFIKADPTLNTKIGIFIGTLDTLEVEAVVVPCNQYFQSCKEFALPLPLPSSNAFNTDIIHEGAGPFLRKECNFLQICPIGSAKVTGGYLLPARFVIHTAAPTKDLPENIETCYINSLRLAIEYDIETIAFPCISTGGLNGIPPQKAAEMVLRAVREFLEEYHVYFQMIVFCLKDDTDIISYQDFLPRFFPF